MVYGMDVIGRDAAYVYPLSLIVIYLMSVYYRNLTRFNRWQLYVSSKFNVSQCDKSLCAGFNPITTWQQRAATP